MKELSPAQKQFIDAVAKFVAGARVVGFGDFVASHNSAIGTALSLILDPQDNAALLAAAEEYAKSTRAE